MSILAEAFIAAFDSNTELIWTTEGAGVATACFQVSGIRVETTFLETSKGEWRVGFEAISKASAMEGIQASICVFSGVLQAVREFLEVRHPEKLVFASKEEALGHIYEEYLQREDTSLHEMGYRMATPLKMSPLTEFVIKKATPSAWRD
jgi:hypothetical protein